MIIDLNTLKAIVHDVEANVPVETNPQILVKDADIDNGYYYSVLNDHGYTLNGEVRRGIAPVQRPYCETPREAGETYCCVDQEKDVALELIEAQDNLIRLVDRTSLRFREVVRDEIIATRKRVAELKENLG